jgi:hypothetical protein
MRRTSIVAPLLLIVIGILFLARNLYPDLPLIDYLARYWPFLLIIWGVLRLGEILIWAAGSKPLPARGLSGGEWMLVFFLVFFGASLNAVRSFPNWLPGSRVTLGGLELFGENYDYAISGEKPSSKTPRVVIESFRGNARIVGGDVDSVKVTGQKTIRSLTQSGADRANQDSPLEFAGDANQITVRTNQDRAGGTLRISENLEIAVPRGAAIEAHGRNGDFDVTGIGGNVAITSDEAGVRLQDIGGEVHVDVRRGTSVRAANVKGALELKGRLGSDVDLENIEGPVTIAGAYNGLVAFHNLAKSVRFKSPIGTEMSFEQVPGEVRMTLGDFTASNLVGPVQLSVHSRDVQLGDFTNALDLTVDRGDIQLRPGKLPLARMDVRTHSGDIELSLPAAAKFDLTASAARGAVTNEFGDPLTLETNGRRGRGGRGSVLRGSAGGGPMVNVHTDRGNVIVRKSSTGDQPLVPRGDLSKPREIPVPARPLKKIEQ